MSDML